MKKVKLLAFISAIATALLLLFFLNSLENSKEAAKAAVITAAADIPANTPITAEMIKISNLPVEAVLPGTLNDVTKAVGKLSDTKIFAGEQLLAARLISVGQSSNKTLAYTIEPGYRAITISVDATSGIANMITPGNHIDIIGEFLDEDNSSAAAKGNGGAGSGGKKTSYTTMVLENITVLAVDNVLSKNGKVGSESPAYATITLQVTPQQAMELSMAQYEGQLRTILRSPLDDKKTNLPSITLDNVMVK